MLILLLWTSISIASGNVLNIVQGKIRGTSHDGYISYNGIPYASITNTTAGRFLQAGIAPFWAGIRETPPPCTSSSEAQDCLQLDVHVPLSTGAPFPVLVWVKGGSGVYKPGKIVREGIVVVIVSHRLNPIGFICTNDEGIPGNTAVKDVVSALRWVQDNVVAFGGTPHKVVVAGQGLGAAMVETVMLSPMASGLFHGAVLQSGTVLSPSVFNYDADVKARVLSKKVGKGNDLASLILKADTADLRTKFKNIDLPYYIFGICADKSFRKDERLLFDAPVNLLKDHKVIGVPTIIGYNTDEAYVFVHKLQEAQVLRQMRRDKSMLVPDELKMNEREIKDFANKISSVYFSEMSIKTLLIYYRDAYFLSHIHRSMKMHVLASSKPVYFYQFSRAGDVGVRQEIGLNKTGAAHSDELAYLFSERKLYEDDEDVQRNLIQLWTNFVKFLNPAPRHGVNSPEWNPINLNDFQVLDINKDLKMQRFSYAREMDLWDDIYERYYYTKSRN